jgi:hypothetical protein
MKISRPVFWSLAGTSMVHGGWQWRNEGSAGFTLATVSMLTASIPHRSDLVNRDRSKACRSNFIFLDKQALARSGNSDEIFSWENSRMFFCTQALCARTITTIVDMRVKLGD